MLGSQVLAKSQRGVCNGKWNVFRPAKLETIFRPRKGYRGRSVSERNQEARWKKSTVRARVEQSFGRQAQFTSPAQDDDPFYRDGTDAVL